MATNHNVLADALDRMALQQEAVIEAARAFRAVGSVEAAIAAREADLRSVNKTIEAKKQELASLDERLRTGNDTLEKLKAEAAKQVAEQIAAARERADEMVSAAEAQAATFRGTPAVHARHGDAAHRRLEQRVLLGRRRFGAAQGLGPQPGGACEHRRTDHHRLRTRAR